MNFDALMKRTLKTLEANSSVILTGAAVAGTVTTAIFAAKGHAEAQFEEFQRGYDPEREFQTLPPKEYLQRYYGHYIPAAVSGTMTIACIVGIHSVNTRKQAVLVSAYSAVDKAFENYKEKNVEVLGEKKEKDLRDELVKDAVYDNPVSNQPTVYGKGEQLCYETLTGRYFMCDIETIRRAENDIRETTYHDSCASLNEFFSKIGLPQAAMGETHGWSMDRPIELDFASILTEDGRPCLTIDYMGMPHINYYKLG